MATLGVDLGGTNIKAALVDEAGYILREISKPTNLPRPAESVCDDIIGLCRELMVGNDVRGIGVGCPGTVDDSCGMVLYSNNLAWFDFAMGPYLEQRLQVPVRLANDANAAALGEALAGCAKNADSAVILTLGTGVGGGVVLNGKLLTGYTGGGFRTRPYGSQRCTRRSLVLLRAARVSGSIRQRNGTDSYDTTSDASSPGKRFVEDCGTDGRDRAHGF